MVQANFPIVRVADNYIESAIAVDDAVKLHEPMKGLM